MGVKLPINPSHSLAEIDAVPGSSGTSRALADSTQAYHRPGPELSGDAVQARTSSARPLFRPSAASAPGSAPSSGRRPSYTLVTV